MLIHRTYGPRNIKAIQKVDRCMWNIIVAYVVLAYVEYNCCIRNTGVECVPSIKVLSLLCDMAMASNAWRHKQSELLCIR